MPNIEQVISKDYTVCGRGRYLKTLEHDSLVIDTEKQLFFWNSKNISGDALSWLTKVKGMPFPLAVQELKLENHFPAWVAEYKSNKHVVVHEDLVDSFFELGKQHRDYWRNHRGFSDSTIDLFKLGYTGEWYVIPIFINNKLRNFQCRKPDKSMKHWYSGVGPLPFNIDLVKHTSWFVLTEGPPDAIMLTQHGIPAMSTNTGGGYFDPRWVPLLPKLERVYIVYDNDDAGRNGVEKSSRVFGHKALAYTFEGYPDKFDISNFFMGGGTKQEFLELVEKNSRYWFEIGR